MGEAGKPLAERFLSSLVGQLTIFRAAALSKIEFWLYCIRNYTRRDVQTGGVIARGGA
jgi:hypothetical protein